MVFIAKDTLATVHDLLYCMRIVGTIVGLSNVTLEWLVRTKKTQLSVLCTVCNCVCVCFVCVCVCAIPAAVAVSAHY